MLLSLSSRSYPPPPAVPGGESSLMPWFVRFGGGLLAVMTVPSRKPAAAWTALERSSRSSTRKTSTRRIVAVVARTTPTPSFFLKPPTRMILTGMSRGLSFCRCPSSRSRFPVEKGVANEHREVRKGQPFLLSFRLLVVKEQKPVVERRAASNKKDRLGHKRHPSSARRPSAFWCSSEMRLNFMTWASPRLEVGRASDPRRPFSF